MNNQPSTNSSDDNVPINTPASTPAEPVFQPENPPTVPQNPTPAQPAPAATPAPTPPTEPPPPSTPPVNQPPVKNVPQEPTPPTGQTPATTQSQPNHIEAEEYGLQPPVKQPKPHSSVALITTIAILFLGLGFGGGFFGYKYVPKFKNMLGATADTDKTTTETATKVANNNSAIDTSIDTATWKTYTNTKYKYSINYPGNWLSDSLTDKEIKTIQFTSYKQDAGSTSADGYKVEITFQDSNGKTLKDWVDNNNTISKTTATPTKTTVGSKEAYQQELNEVSKSISTYILQNNLVMIISYYASDAKFSTGKPYYDQMIESLKFS